MKKLLSVILILALLLPVAAAMADIGTMFVYTANGKSLNVRSSDRVEDNIIGHLKYGAKVHVQEFINDWAVIDWGDTCAYVQSRFLQWYKPDPKPTPDPAEKEKEEKEAKRKAEIASERDVEDTFMILVSATRASGWINVRKGPSSLDKRIESCPDGTKLEVIGETDNWYRITDPANGKEGYIFKQYTRRATNPEEKPAGAEEELGTLNVNGAFTLQCKLPKGYKLNVITSQSHRIIANLTPKDTKKPQMMLNITYDEMFSDVDRLNDLTAEEIEQVKESFKALNEVEFTEMETSHGTKLLVAKETGDDSDFVDIITIYKGYSIEFVLAPNSAADDQTLTDKQIQTCVDFLSDLDFIPAA